MTSHDVEVTVVIPAYNAEQTIEDQLAALARQNVDFSWEIVIADNGSTDSTAQIAQRWRERLPLRIVDASARRGASAARNIAVENARGRYLAFCDADDVVSDTWLETMRDALMDHELVGAGGRRRHLHTSELDASYYVMAAYALPFFPQLPLTGGGHMGVHRAVYQSVGGYDESIRVCEDVDLCWRLQLAGHTLTAWPDAIISIRRRDTLVALARQSFATGRGERYLKHRYARVIQAYQTQFPVAKESVNRPAELLPRDSPGRVVQRAIRKLLTLRQASDVARVVNVISLRLGQRYGRIDRSAPQIEPPTPLPAPPPPPPAIVDVP